MDWFAKSGVKSCPLLPQHTHQLTVPEPNKICRHDNLLGRSLLNLDVAGPKVLRYASAGPLTCVSSNAQRQMRGRQIRQDPRGLALGVQGKSTGPS